MRAMADNRTPPPSRPAASQPRVTPDAGHIPITEELDKAKWTLPPIGIVVIGLAVVAIVIAAYSYFGRSKPVGQGGATDVFAIASGETSVMVLINFELTNVTEKTITIKQLAATLNTGGKDYNDDHAASAVDYPRYIQAFPELGQHAQKPIMPETRLAPGQRIAGSALFNFDATKDQFDSRQSLVLHVVPYDRPAFDLAEKRGGK